MSSHSNGHQFGDTTLIKVFVGGLAWETPADALREHFQQYGDILEAVIIYDKLTARSKGYGFVTFKEAEAAVKACEDAAPMISGRRANCNLASLGAKPISPQTVVSVTATHQGFTIPISTTTSGVIAAGQVRWYYPSPQAVPYYPFSPAPASAYAPTNLIYNQKMGGFYSNGQVYHVAAAAAHQMMPMYPLYQYHNHAISFPPHVFPAVHRLPKPTTTFVPPNPGAMVGV